MTSTDTDDDDVFYPGSRRIRRSQGGEAPELPEPDVQEWQRFGKTYLTDSGSPQVFYPISALGMALGRKAITMRHWEQDGVIPKPLRSVSSSSNGRRRMYTYDQIVGLQQIAKEEGLMSGQRVYVTKTAFGARAEKLFRELEES